MKKIKIILDEPYNGMNSGWPTRYIGFMKELSRYYCLSIFAPGNTEALKVLFPGAEVSASTSGDTCRPKFSKVNYLKSFIRPNRREVYIPGFFFYPGFLELLKKDTGSFDISFYFGLESYSGYGDVDSVKLIICDLCDSMLRHIETRKKGKFQLRNFLSYHIEAAYIKKIYRKFLPKDAVLLATTQKDGEDISNLMPGKKVYSVPNGTAVPAIRFDEPFFQKKLNSHYVVFLGSLDYEANLTSIFYSMKEIWPDLRQKYSHLRFRIVGRNPAPELIKKAATVPGVEIIGEVQDVYPYLIDARVFLAPMFSGGGIKNKFLESLSVGTPIVTNKEGAVGIDLVSGKHGVIAESADDLVAAIDTMLNLPYDPYTQYVRECIALARSYSWESAGNKLRSIIDGAIR